MKLFAVIMLSIFPLTALITRAQTTFKENVSYSKVLVNEKYIFAQQGLLSNINKDIRQNMEYVYPDLNTVIIEPVIEDPVKLTVLYDNYLFAEGTKTDWGFSCLIEGTEKTILFDAGTKSDILFHNIDKLNVDITAVELIVISHDHGDHTGGLSKVLEKIKDIPVYSPVSFPKNFFTQVEEAKSHPVKVDDPVEVCDGVYLTGELGTSIKEQALILDTKKGLILITGCSHPGIVDIIKRAKEIVKKEVYLVFGGFHLMGHSENQLNEIIKNFRELGVQNVGATHCTGDKAIEMFKKEYGENYVAGGTGRILKF